MGLEVWFREDIENRLLAAYVEMQAIARNVSTDTPQTMAYCRGFEDALKCVATSFGVRLLLQRTSSFPEVIELPSLAPKPTLSLYQAEARPTSSVATSLR
jgi:hypothetical protein